MLTKIQARLTARLLVAFLIEDIFADGGKLATFVDDLKHETRVQLTHQENKMIRDELEEIKERFLGEHLRFSSVEEIINYCKSPAKAD